MLCSEAASFISAPGRSKAEGELVGAGRIGHGAGTKSKAQSRGVRRDQM
jgi:hypothetical protein